MKPRTTRTLTVTGSARCRRRHRRGRWRRDLRGVDSDDTQTMVRQVAVGDSESAASTSTLSLNEIYERTHLGVVEITVTSNEDSQVPFGGFPGRSGRRARASSTTVTATS